MIETSDSPQPVHPAATLVLVRDSPRGIEALLVQRSESVRHMGGMWVFPGGRVEESDYPADRDDFEAARMAATRETREEAGLEIDPDQLIYLSHWTTPEGAKKRFATWFFLAPLQGGQDVTVDGGEIARHRWFTPAEAFREMADDASPFHLMPPTFISLVDIADYADCRQARAGLARREVPVFAPRMVFIEGGICFLYEGDAGYAGTELEAEGRRHRAYLVDGRLEYVRRT